MKLDLKYPNVLLSKQISLKMFQSFDIKLVYEQTYLLYKVITCVLKFRCGGTSGERSGRHPRGYWLPNLDMKDVRHGKRLRLEAIREGNIQIT